MAEASADPVKENGPDIVYGTAAAFVRFLIQRFGKAAFLEFYRRLDGVVGREDLNARFEEAFSVALSATIESWRVGPQPIVDDVALTIPGCDDSLTVTPAPSAEVDPECATRRFRFEVPGTGRLDLAVSGEVLPSPVQL